MVTSFTVHITPYNLDRTIYLYLPDDYQSGKRYPVLYMYDGHNLFYDEVATYGTCWGLKSYLDENPRCIVVGQDCNHEGDMRLREYCPYDVDFFSGIKGTGKEYMNWLTRELKPYIDEHYPTLPEREHTAVGGSSMGGLMSLYSVLAHNDVFSKAACLSPSSFICMDQLESELERATINSDTRIYLSWGEKELRRHRNWVDELNRSMLYMQRLEHEGACVYPYIQPGGGHSEAFWAEQVPRFMDYLFTE